MRILMLAGNTYLPIKEFNHSRNGLGYTIGLICVNLAVENEVFLLTQSAFTAEQNYKNIHIIKKSWMDVIRSFSFKYLKAWLKDTRNTSFFSQTKYRTFAYYLTGHYVEKQINRLKPDIVNVSGLHFPTAPFIIACKNTHIPYVVSLHGLSTFNKELEPSKDMVKLERRFLSSIDDIYVSVVASGVKKRIEEYLKKTLPNIRVILNGIERINPLSIQKNDNLRKTLAIPSDAKVIISVSSVNKNKNQIQVLNAIALMPASLKEKIVYLVCGNGDYEKVLVERAKALHLEKHLRMCGYVKNSNIAQYYAISDVNMMVSFSEGFGCSVVEGYMQGIPVVMYSDLDAAYDLYDKNSTILVHDRTDEALSKGIIKALESDWQKNAIINFSKNFTGDKMTCGYNNYFKEVVENEICNS